MALKFYLHQIDNAHEIHCNTTSTITEIAGAFDLGTMELEWNECKYALLPNTPFFIVDTETNEKWNFIINQDNVEVVHKTNPIKYLHKLTISESIHKINNVALRNTRFTKDFNDGTIIKRAFHFIGKAVYDDHRPDESMSYFRQINQSGETNNNFNTETFQKNNYSVDLSSYPNIPAASIKVSTILNTFNGMSMENFVWKFETPRAKFLNKGVSELWITLINYDNSSDRIILEISQSDIENQKEIALTSSNLEWIRGKKFYMQLTYADLIPNVITDSNGMQLTSPMANPYGATGQPFVTPSISGMVFLEIIIPHFVSQISLWDVLDILNKQCIKHYNDSSLPNYYEMPDKTTGQGLELANIEAPEFNLSQLDLFEAVAKVLSYIDAYPVMKTATINGVSYDNVLGFEYLNNLSDETINDLQMSDINTTLNEDKFTNKIATYFQNGKKNSPISYPGKNKFRSPSTTKYGTPDSNDWYFMVSKPIDYVKRLTMMLYGDNGSTIESPHIIAYDFGPTDHETQEVDFKYLKLASYSDFNPNDMTHYNDSIDYDLTSVLYREEVYSLLEVGSASNTGANKNNSLYYAKNDTKIYLGITGQILSDATTHDVLEYALKRAVKLQFGFGTGDGVITHYIDKMRTYFTCDYYPILDGKVAQESTVNKIEKETVVSQESGNINLERLGNNLQGLIARIGNEEKSIALPITKFKDRVKIGTHYVDELGNNWIVNKVKTTFTTNPDKVIVEANFVKNFNALQQFTSLNQEKRFYDIDNQLSDKGFENINEFIYFTTNSQVNISAQATNIALNLLAIQTIIGKTLSNDGSVTGTNIASLNSVLDNVAIITEGLPNEIMTYIPTVVYGNGNQICIEMSFEDSFSAGRKTNGNMSSQSTTWNTEVVPYVDQTGKQDTFTILGSFIEKDNFYKTQNYPNTSASYSSVEGDLCFTLALYDYYKKPNEIFHTNYSLCFMPYWEKTAADELGNHHYKYEEIFFGDMFINENGIIPNNKYENKLSRKLCLYVSNQYFSIIDNKVPSNATRTYGSVVTSFNGTGGLLTGSATYGSIEFRNTNNQVVDLSEYIGSKSWCIGDEDGNVYIAVNRKKESQRYTRLYFFTSRNRKV